MTAEFEFFLNPNENVSLQIGFNRETEDVVTWQSWDPVNIPAWPFRLIPSGPISIESTDIPAGGDLLIAESPDLASVVNWTIANQLGWAGMSIGEIHTRTITIPPGLSFKHYLTIQKPFAAIIYTGLDLLRVVAHGLVDRAPSTLRRAVPIEVMGPG